MNARQLRAINREPVTYTKVEIASFLIAAIALVAILVLHLLSGVLAGLLVYQLILITAPLLERRLSSRRSLWISVVLLSVAIIGLLTAAIIGTVDHVERVIPNAQVLVAQLSSILDGARARLPEWAQVYIPVDHDDMRNMVFEYARKHMVDLQQGSISIARTLTHIVIGMILGAMIAISVASCRGQKLPLTAALAARASRFSDAFRRIVFAQVKISFINAVFTGLYLLVALPLFHTYLPLSKTLVLLAFVVGLLPVIGNLISNTAILVISMSVSLPVAIASLAFLVAIHKLEYFLNARIIGGEIEARAWELLIAMLVMEATFGIPGVIAAPIFYAYIKRELIVAQLV
ncbi:AI-2E family transporter [Pararobbsia silviterrae]|uniref:AI-2E family transporter n=1 Tax=Pararobbsia silviterrae TaxID=1792498 RepID=A0A494Y830_9BURK|nr:AI-2E family transporter [Pararobbsia silviterrae]RKP58849.1 AI-2E family transporter [Pararobbsia silviterrae]